MADACFGTNINEVWGMYKLTETEVLTQPSEYVDEKNFVGMYSYETTEGDGGYLDTFNALKNQIDFNYVQYKEQLKSLVKRLEDVKSDRNHALKLVLIVGLFPIAYNLLLQILVIFGMDYGLPALIYSILNIFNIPVILVCEVILMPIFAKNLANHIGQYRILTSDEFLKDYRKNNNIISFQDEKRFLKKTIMEYDTFYELVAVEGLDRKDGNLAGSDSDVLTEDQRKVLDKMRSLSVFKEYKATVGLTRKEVGIKWLIIGLGLLMGLGIVVANFFI